jgi:hypothetical protein
VPRVRDHDPRYCATCQFWLAACRGAGIFTGIVTSLLAVSLVLGILAVGGFFAFVYFQEHPGKFVQIAEMSGVLLTMIVLVVVGSLVIAGIAGWWNALWRRRSVP